MSIFEPYVIFKLIEQHEKSIKKMNAEIEEDILSFEDNPLIGTNTLELENIIIEE